MVKKAYQKLCFYPLVRIAVFGILLSTLLYQFHGLLSAGDELVARVFWGICLGFGALHGALLTMSVIRYVIQVQWAGRRLRDLPSYVRERLDQDLQTGDRLDDLYFTSDFLLVYQIHFQRKQGFACIPYPEIGGVSIGKNGRAKNQMDILSPEGAVLHTVTCSLETSQAQAEKIERKILSLKSRMQTVKDSTEEQSQRDRAAKQALKKMLSGLPAFFCSLAAVLGFLASLVIAEHYRKKAALMEALQFPEDTYGAFLFWPNLLLYVVMYSGILVMLAGDALLVRNLLRSKDAPYTERVSKIRILLFIGGAVLFVLFLGSVYTADGQTWENMTRGFYLLFQDGQLCQVSQNIVDSLGVQITFFNRR